MTDDAAAADVIDVGETPEEPGTELATVAGMALAPVEHGSLIAPAASTEQVVAMFQAYQELCDKLLTPDDFQGIEGKQFRKRSGWRKLATAMSVDFRIVSREHMRAADGSLLRSEFVCAAVAPNGRTAEGWGNADVHERCQLCFLYGKNPCKEDCTRHCGRENGDGTIAWRCSGRKHFSKPEHDIPATAETRAKNRAAADLFGMGEVSAEEVDKNDPANRYASMDEINLLFAAAKAVKKQGGDPGKFPVVLGVTVIDAIEKNPGEEDYWRWTITSGKVEELLSELEQMLAGLGAAKDGNENAAADAAAKTSAESEAAPQLPAPQPRQGSAEESPAQGDDPESAALPAADSEVEPEDGQATGSDVPSEESDPVAPPSGEAAPDAVEGDATEAATVGAAPPAPGDEAFVESGKGQRNRFGALCTGIGLTPDERHDLVFLITDGRTRTSTQTSFDELEKAIKAAKLIRDGQLALVYRGEDADRVPELVVPDDAPRDVGHADDGIGSTEGWRYLVDLARFLGYNPQVEE